MEAIIDSRFYSSKDIVWRDMVIQHCKSNKVGLVFTEIRQRGKLHSLDLVTAINIGCSISSVIIALIALLKKPQKEATYEMFLKEVESFLKLKGISEFKILKIEGFENIIKKNAQPCIIYIENVNKTQFHIYTGITKEFIIVSPVEYNPNEF